MPSIIPNKVINDYHDALLADEALIKVLENRRGINRDTIERYMIGWDGNRYTIPIKDATNAWVNVRKWKAQVAEGEPKIISYDKGYGENRIFPIENVNKYKNLIICEGEWDCLLLNQHKMNAITTTCGVQTWNDDWNNYLNGKNIVIIFDCDDVGREASKKLGERLMASAAGIKIIDLGLNDKEDITDWFTKYTKSKDELKSRIRETDQLDLFNLIDLSDGLNPVWYDKKIKFHSIVCGKDLAPYLVPKKVELFCSGCDDIVIGCPFDMAGSNNLTIDMNYDDHKDEIVQMVKSTDTQVRDIIRRAAHIPGKNKCKKVRVNVKSRMSIEDVSVIPEVDFQHERIEEKEYVTRQVYIIGDKIQTNQSYLLKGTTWADPKTQQGIHLITEKKSSRDSISKFVIDEEVKDKLKIFQCDPEEHLIWAKMKEYCKDMRHNVTHIYGRSNIIMATDLVFHSLIEYDFLGRPINKGWLECAVIGDTGTGKTETIRNLLKHYRSGEFLTSGENTTRSGILGGAQQHASRWTLTWGKIPLNDKRLLAVDEADNLAKSGIISLLSGVRSSGIAEIVAIQTQKTMARTRLIWIANPLKGDISEYNYGVEAIRKIFGDQQDIRRVDFALMADKSEVTKDVINKIHKEKFPHKYTSELCHARVMWAWNRHPHHVQWVDNSEQVVLDQANMLSEKYSPEIPLVLTAEIRMKVARMSVALAAMLVSTDDTGEKVYVYPAHVMVASEFLQKMYDSKIMGYNSFSSQRIMSSQLKEPEGIDTYFNDEYTIDSMLETTRVQNSDIEDIFIVERDEARKIIKSFRTHRALKKVSFYYRKTPAFINYLKQRKVELQRGISVTEEEIL